jgi:hypothetical protein
VLRKILILLAMGVAVMSLTSPLLAATAQEKAALASFQSMLDGLGKRDKAAMLATVLPGASGTFIRDGKARQMSVEALADAIAKPSPDTYEERISNPLVRVDHDLAVVWAPFQFFLNGKLDHCGTDIATLVLLEGRWLITTVEDNQRKPCS